MPEVRFRTCAEGEVAASSPELRRAGPSSGVPVVVPRFQPLAPPAARPPTATPDQWCYDHWSWRPLSVAVLCVAVCGASLSRPLLHPVLRSKCTRQASAARGVVEGVIILAVAPHTLGRHTSAPGHCSAQLLPDLGRSRAQQRRFVPAKATASAASKRSPP